MKIKVGNLYKFTSKAGHSYHGTVWKVLEEPRPNERYCMCVCVSAGKYFNENAGWCIIDGWFEPYSEKSNNFKEIYNILNEGEN